MAIIGPRWVDEENLLRLHDKNDIVRYEILYALTTPKLAVVPTLVEDAALPQASVLPDLLRPLLDWNVRRVTEWNWERDARALINEIAQVTSLPVGPGVDCLLEEVAAAQRRVADMELKCRVQADQIEALLQTVDMLTKQIMEISTEHQSMFRKLDGSAFEHLLWCNWTSANTNDAFATAWRNNANWALLNGRVEQAIASYREALAFSSDPETLRLLGGALMLVADWSRARDAFTKSLRKTANEWNSLWSLSGLGDVSMAEGDVSAALAAYRRGLEIIEGINWNVPSNTRWLLGVSRFYAKLGSLKRGVTPQEKRAFLMRGLSVLSALDAEHCLPPYRDSRAFLEEELHTLDNRLANKLSRLLLSLFKLGNYPKSGDH